MSAYKDIQREIQSQASAFKQYIDGIFAECGASGFIDYVSSRTDIYIFSGVIRNYLKGYREFRDIDFVTKESIDISERMLQGHSAVKNKFGGMKLRFNDVTIDVWSMDATWGMMQQKKRRYTPNTLISTAFFNSSAIAFDYRRGRFVISDDFCNFYRNDIIDVVFPDNPIIGSCIINTMYYKNRFGCRIGKRLQKWIVNHYDAHYDFESVQNSRYGRVLYEDSIIKSFVELCKKNQLHAFSYTIEVVDNDCK